MQSNGQETQAEKSGSIPFDHVTEEMLTLPFGLASNQSVALCLTNLAIPSMR
jgi:hypothetical protein